MVIWKSRLWVSVLGSDDVEWERTERNRARGAADPTAAFQRGLSE